MRGTSILLDIDDQEIKKKTEDLNMDCTDRVTEFSKQFSDMINSIFRNKLSKPVHVKLSSCSPLNNDNTKEVVLKVEGMTCSGCEKKVKTALMNCLDVQDCEVSYINGDATVKVAKGSANTAEMINAVEKTGFSAELKEDIQYGAEPKTKGMGEKEVAEEEGILNKVKEIFKPETAAEEKE